MKTTFDFEAYALKNSYVLDFRGCPFVTLLDETIFDPSFYIQMAILGANIQIAKTEIVSADDSRINLRVLSAECPVSQFKRLWSRAEAIKVSPFQLRDFGPEGRDGSIYSLTMGQGSNCATFEWWTASSQHPEWAALDAWIEEFLAFERYLTYREIWQIEATMMQDKTLRTETFAMEFRRI